jgi:hypothetical protein
MVQSAPAPPFCPECHVCSGLASARSQSLPGESVILIVFLDIFCHPSVLEITLRRHSGKIWAPRRNQPKTLVLYFEQVFEDAQFFDRSFRRHTFSADTCPRLVSALDLAIHCFGGQWRISVSGFTCLPSEGFVPSQVIHSPAHCSNPNDQPIATNNTQAEHRVHLLFFGQRLARCSI